MDNIEHGAAELQALGKSFFRAGNLQDAVHHWERALELAPDDATLLYDLAAAHYSAKNYGRARELYEKVISLKPGQAATHNDLGMLFRETGDFDKAFELFVSAAQRDPKNAIFASNLGGSFLERGQLSEARASFQRAVDLAPSKGQYLYQLAETAPFTPADPRLRHMLDLMKSERALDTADRIGLHFALGKALTDVGRHAAAFDHYQIGNGLKRTQIDYDETIAFHQMNEVAAAISKPLLEHLQRLGTSSDTPIFIVGMLRSGSTLVKQILARHPSVEAAGEVPHFSDALYAVLGKRVVKPQQLQEFLETLSRPEIEDLARIYLSKLRSRTGGALRIVDKALPNFRFVGLIRAVFPNAKIIHVVRTPVDTCWSCYSKLFAEPQPFTYELGEVGRYYNAYRDVMRHWREVVPSDAMIEIRYEDLVDDLERTCRRLLAFCELPWDDNCLSFHQGKNLVKTSSAVQVRQPLFREGVGRSTPFVPHLEPLVNALGARQNHPGPGSAG